MDLSKLRSITNHYQDLRLVSLQSWKAASEITPRDKGGPYIVIQEGYDPLDLTVTPDEFLLGRSGQWVSLSYFFRMPVPERRQEFVFGGVAEVMKLIESLPGKPVVFHPGPESEGLSEAATTDDLSNAFLAAKDKPAGA
jgi:hypothetical protein